MSRISGKTGVVVLDDAEVTAVFHVSSWEADYKGDPVDVTGMSDSGAKNYVGGLTEFTARVECFEDPDATLDSDITPAGDCAFQLFYTALDTDAWHGTAIITNKSPQVQVDGAVKWSIDFTATGTVAYETI